MDKVVSTVAALGVPGLILVTAMGATGYVGAAALTTALAALGPGGMIGGIALLGIIGLIAQSISKYGFDAIFKAVIDELQKRGETAESILSKIDKYPITESLKCTLRCKLTSNQS